MSGFLLRPYCESSDFKTLYKAECDYDEKTIAYELCGASPYIPEKRFREILGKANMNSQRFFIVADEGDRPIGYVYTDRCMRIAKHRTIQIRLWTKTELTESILRQTLDSSFSDNLIVNMLIFEVMGNERDLVSACQSVGMEQVGCIPDYFCYEGKLFPEYIFIMKRDSWSRLKSK